MELPATEHGFSARLTNADHRPHSLPPAQMEAIQGTCAEVKQRQGVCEGGHTSRETGAEHRHLRIASETSFCCCDSMTKTT